MKHTMRPFLSLLLAALLLCALPAAASALDLSLTVGQAHETCIEQRAEAGYITGVSITSGSCPGLSLEVNSDGTAAYLRGTPTTAGDYTLSVSVLHAEGDPYSTTISIHVEAAAEPTPTPSSEPEVPVDVTPEPTSEPEIVIDDPSGKQLVITKDPTGETKTEGGSAMFIAHADNDTEIVWLLVSADGKTTHKCSEAPSHFPGLQVSGLGTDELVLSNLPLSISGWSVQAMFNGEGGPLYTKKALITVNRKQLDAPSILTQPKSAESGGSPVTLRVVASAEEGELRYQWYKNSSDRNIGGQAIVGATGSSFTPAETEGSWYYYVTVWAVSGDRSSISVSSKTAAVSFTPAAEPTPSAEPAPSAEPEPSVEPEPTVEPAPTPVPTPTPTPEPEPARRGGSPALIVAAVLLLLGAAASVGVYIYLRRRDKMNDEYDDE